MKLRELAYLADENLDPEVVGHLRSIGWNIRHAAELGLRGMPDLDVLRAAYAESRVILTHDGDFGGLAVVGREPLVGIVYLRPGHIRADITIATFDAVVKSDPDVRPPFILVARRANDEVTVRIRPL